MDRAIAEADRRFEIPGIAQLVEGNGGLPKVRITVSYTHLTLPTILRV